MNPKMFFPKCDKFIVNFPQFFVLVFLFHKMNKKEYIGMFCGQNFITTLFGTYLQKIMQNIKDSNRRDIYAEGIAWQYPYS